MLMGGPKVSGSGWWFKVVHSGTTVDGGNVVNWDGGKSFREGIVKSFVKFLGAMDRKLKFAI